MDIQMEESSQIELYSCPAVRKRPLQPAVSPVADPFEDSQTTEEEAMEAEVIRMFTAWYTIDDDDEHPLEACRDIYMWSLQHKDSTSLLTHQKIQEGNMTISLKVVEEACEFLVKHDLFINVAGKRRIKQYFVNPATVPKVHIKEKPPPPKRVATPPSKPRRIRFPTRRELGEADGRYYKPEIVAALMDGKELEILGSDGTHHAVVYRKENGGCLVFAHRPDEVAVSGGVAQYCLAAKGTFGREKGMKRSRSAVLGELEGKGEDRVTSSGFYSGPAPRDLLGTVIPTERVAVIAIDTSPAVAGGEATEGAFRKRLREVLPTVSQIEQQSEQRTDLLMRQLKDRVREVEEVLDSFGDQFAVVAEELAQRATMFRECKEKHAGKLASLSESKDYFIDGGRDLIKEVRQTALAWQVDCKKHISSLEARGRACLNDMATTKAKLKAQQDF